MTNLPSTNITRAHLADAVCRATGLPKADAGGLVEMFLDLISEALLRREPVMISGFGKFIVIEPRLAIVFKPAPGLFAQLKKHSGKDQAPGQKTAAGA